MIVLIIYLKSLEMINLLTLQEIKKLSIYGGGQNVSYNDVLGFCRR